MYNKNFGLENKFSFKYVFLLKKSLLINIWLLKNKIKVYLCRNKPLNKAK